MPLRSWSASLLAVGAAVVAAPLHSAEGGHWDVVDQYCVSCHNTDRLGRQACARHPRPRRGRRFREAETWEKVVRRMRGRLMPPPGEPRPANAKLDAFVHWMEGRIDAAAASMSSPGYVPLHRLNRREYTNAVRVSARSGVRSRDAAAAGRPERRLRQRRRRCCRCRRPSSTSTSPRRERLRCRRSAIPGARPVGTPYTQSRSAVRSTSTSRVCRSARAAAWPSTTSFRPMASTSSTSTTWRVRCGSRAWSSRTRWSRWSTAVKIYEMKLGGDEDQKAIDQKGDPPVDAINKRLKNIRFKATAGQHRVVVTFRARTLRRVRCAPRLARAGRR